MAFQIIDDILDLREGTQRLGKPAGQDLRQGTVTLPTMLYAAKLAPTSTDTDRLRAVVAGDIDGDAEIDQLVTDIRASGALDEAFAVAEGFADSAKARIAFLPDDDTRDLLEDLTDLAIGRRS